MPEWIGPSAVIGLLTVAALFIGHLFTRRNNKDTLLMASRDNHIDDLREDVRLTKEDNKDLRSRLETIEETVSSQSTRIRDLEVREWSLRRYVYKLIDRIRELGGEPPEPPHDLQL